MKGRFYQIVAILALCLAAAAFAVALWSSAVAQEEAVQEVMAIPTTLNYQGLLRQPDGSLTNGAYDITARIYSAATGGSPLYETTLPGVTVRDGLFNIVLGDSPPLPASVLANSPRYIGISLNGGAELIPRQRLHAVPWAFQAQTLVNNAPAQTVQGLTSNGNVAVNGDATITGDATLNGSVYVGSPPFPGPTPVPGESNIYVTGSLYAPDGGATIYPGDGWWGDWYDWTYCPIDTYVCGARVRIEWYGQDDDTAMNGIQLKCCSLGRDPSTVPVSEMAPSETTP